RFCSPVFCIGSCLSIAFTSTLMIFPLCYSADGDSLGCRAIAPSASGWRDDSRNGAKRRKSGIGGHAARLIGAKNLSVQSEHRNRDNFTVPPQLDPSRFNLVCRLLCRAGIPYMFHF